MRKMSKEEFLEILFRQERSGLRIKDFCTNEAYTESSFYYWKGKFGLSRPYRSRGELSSGEAFAPVNFTCPSSPHLGKTDMRKGMNSLCGVIHDKMGYDVCLGDVFIFINRQHTTMDLLHAEDGGLGLYRYFIGDLRITSKGVIFRSSFLFYTIYEVLER